MIAIMLHGDTYTPEIKIDFKFKYLFITLVCLFIGIGQTLAQQRNTQPRLTINGVINSAVDGQVLAGATIKIKGTNQTAITNEKGEFSLKTDRREGALEVSFLGYIKKEIEFNTSTSRYLSIQLEPDENLLSDVDVVVSTGYQNIPKERATGSFVHIDNELLNRSVSTDIISRLKGIAPSLLFDERAGGEPKLSIRGRSTIFANADPLIVVDNFPYEGDIRNINPNDVEDISILRDAAAASIWGVRAGNGVIVITTKKGKKNQPMKISVNSNVTVGAKPDLWYEKKISSSDLIELQTFLYGKGYYTAKLNNVVSYPIVPLVPEILHNPTLSEQEKQQQLAYLSAYDIREDLNRFFYQKKIQQQYNLNVQGGGEKQSYILSAGYNRNRLERVGNENDRLNLSARQVFNPWKELELSSGIYFTQQNRKTNLTLQTLQYADAYTPLVDATGIPLPVARDYNTKFAASAEEKGLLNWQFKPLDELALSNQQGKEQYIRLQQSLAISIFSGLKAEAYYQYEKQHGLNRNHSSQEAYTIRSRINSYALPTKDGFKFIFPFGDQLTDRHEEMNMHNGRAQLNYHYQNKAHQLYLLAGGEIRQAITSGKYQYIYGYDPENGIGIPLNHDSLYVQYPSKNRSRIPSSSSVSGTLDRFRSWYFNGSYTFQSKYIVSASARIDQSNLFGVHTNQRTVPLWSTGLKWRTSEESFFTSEVLKQMDVRATYGLNGNSDNRATAFTTVKSAYFAGTGLTQATISGLPNNLLRWEKTALLNLGIDFSFKNVSLYGSIDFYKRKGKDLLGYGPLEPTTGATTYYGNQAHMKGSGVDLELNFQSKGIFKWTTSLINSYVRDEVTGYSQTPSLTAYLTDASLTGASHSPTIGKPLFSVFSFPWAGLDPETGKPRGYLNGLPSIDYSGINRMSVMDSLVFHGRATPPWYGSFRNQLSYGSFSISAIVTYKLGYYFRRSSIDYGLLLGSSVGHSDYGDRWQLPGDENHTSVPAFQYPVNASSDQFYKSTSVLVERGDQIRLQDIRVSYQFRPSSGYLAWCKDASLSIYANNLGIIWRANQQKLDPDYANGVIPLPLTLSLGLNINF